MSLSGRLVNSSGSPSSGFWVRVYPPDSLAGFAKRAAGFIPPSKADSVMTDAEGRFYFTNLEKGTYNLSANGPQGNALLAIFLRDLVITGNTYRGTDTVRITGSILLQVQMAGDQAAVGALCQISGTPWKAYANSQGVCVMTGLPPGNFEVIVTHPEYPEAASISTVVVSGSQSNGGTIHLGNITDHGPS